MAGRSSTSSGSATPGSSSTGAPNRPCPRPPPTTTRCSDSRRGRGESRPAPSGHVATQDVFSAEELARLRGFPEINRAELIQYLTLTGADEAFVRQFRTGRNVLGVAVQLCTLPWRSRPAQHAGRVDVVPAPVRPGRARGGPVRRRAGHRAAAAGGQYPGRPVRDRCPEGPGRRAGRVRADEVGRLPRRRGAGRRRHRVPPVLGAGRAGRPALRRHLHARPAPVRRSGVVPAHPAGVGAAEGGVLPPGRQTGRGRCGCRSRRCWWRSTPGPGSPTTWCKPAGRSPGRWSSSAT
ncbi:hypothetical protein DMB66_14495 [Actinoplanes sp. ATCC 53533]|nr:hypothetical protein DMB66_14495 [Actinoplanes sp. ATCC 53533]